MKKHFLLKNVSWKSSFSRSLASVANVSNFTTCVSLNQQPCITRPTIINLNPDEHNQGFCYYTFMIKLDKCNGSCNTLDDVSLEICVPNKLENLN